MNVLNGKPTDKNVTRLSLNLNLDEVKPGVLMKIDSEREGTSVVGQVYTVNHEELTLFSIDEGSCAEVKEFHINDFINGTCIPHIIKF